MKPHHGSPLRKALILARARAVARDTYQPAPRTYQSMVPPTSRRSFFDELCAAVDGTKPSHDTTTQEDRATYNELWARVDGSHYLRGGQ